LEPTTSSNRPTFEKGDGKHPEAAAGKGEQQVKPDEARKWREGHNFPPRHPRPALFECFLRFHVGHAAQVEKGSRSADGRDQESQREFPRLGLFLEHQPAEKQSRQRAGLQKPLIPGKKPGADFLGQNFGQPRQPRPAGNPPQEIENEQKPDQERQFPPVAQKTQKRNGHDGKHAKVPRAPARQHKPPVAEALQMMGRGDLENGEQRRQRGDDAEQRGACAEAFGIEHERWPEENLERNGVIKAEPVGIGDTVGKSG